MRVTERTKYKTFQAVEPYIDAKSVKQLKRASEHIYGGMYDLTFEKFYACANGDFSHLGDLKDATVLQVYWCKRFNEFVVEFANALKSLALPQTPDEARASSSLLKIQWAEGLLVFMQQFFGLKSFKDAEQITIGELLIAKRAQYNRDKYQRELSKIQTAKFRRKK